MYTFEEAINENLQLTEAMVEYFLATEGFEFQIVSGRVWITDAFTSDLVAIASNGLYSAAELLGNLGY
jgi:hypothetical protein